MKQLLKTLLVVGFLFSTLSVCIASESFSQFYCTVKKVTNGQQYEVVTIDYNVDNCYVHQGNGIVWEDLAFHPGISVPKDKCEFQKGEMISGVAYRGKNGRIFLEECGE